MSQEAERQPTDSEPEYLLPRSRYFPLVPLYWKKHLKTLNPLLLIAISHIRRSSNAKSDAPINTPDQLFHDGDPTQGIEGTLVTAGYLNNQRGATRDLQQELLNVLGGAHIQPDPKKTDQLLTALRALLLSRKNPFGDIKSDGTVPTALENLGLGE
ncbi:hypothetical protein O5699_03960, partial [Escherichia coli]|nr:hypothetical protein [Escherichia coli]